MTRKILVLNGHPAGTSLNRFLADSYADAAQEAGHDVRRIHLHDVQFDIDKEFGGYARYKPLEPALEEVLDALDWAEHLVMTTPLWWGGVPAKLKGLFDRALLPGRAFDTRNTSILGLPRPMLGGRSARVIVTADTPGFLERLVYRNAILHQLRGQILGFVGFKPVRFTWLAEASHPKEGKISQWHSKMQELGHQAA